MFFLNPPTRILLLLKFKFVVISSLSIKFLTSIRLPELLSRQEVIVKFKNLLFDVATDPLETIV